AVSSGTLPAAVREQLAIATAQLNGREYCLSAHTYIGGKVAKANPAQLDAARRAESGDPHAPALLRLSNAITEKGRRRRRGRHRGNPGRGSHRRGDRRGGGQPGAQHPDELPQRARRRPERLAGREAVSPYHRE